MDFLFSFFKSQPTTLAHESQIESNTIAIQLPHAHEMSSNGGVESKDPSDEERQQQQNFSATQAEQQQATNSDDQTMHVYVDKRTKEEVEESLFRHEIVYCEPYPEFYNDCFEYFIISPSEYGLRRVGSKRIHYLVRESSVVFHWCVELELATIREQRLQTRTPQTNNDDALLNAKTLKGDASIVDERVPGVMGVFVEDVLECDAKFAFTRPDKTVKIVQFNTSTPTTTAAVTPKSASIFNQQNYVKKSGTPVTVTKSMNNSGIALMANDYLVDERIDTLSDIMLGQKRMSDYYKLDSDASRWHLKRFERHGETGRRAEVAAKTEPPFTTVSPVTPNNGRWYVISPHHWALFMAWKRMHERSGALLYRLPTLITQSETNNVGITQMMGAGHADKDIPIEHQRRIIQRILDFERQESDNDRTIRTLQAQLQHEAARLVEMQADLNRLKIEKQSFVEKLSNLEPGDSIIKSFNTRIDSIKQKLNKLKFHELDRCEKK